MTTAIDLSAEEIAELKALTNESEVASAVRKAMVEYLQYARRQRLKTLSGQVQMQENWQEMEATELRPGHEAAGSGPH